MSEKVDQSNPAPLASQPAPLSGNISDPKKLTRVDKHVDRDRLAHQVGSEHQRLLERAQLLRGDLKAQRAPGFWCVVALE